MPTANTIKKKCKIIFFGAEKSGKTQFIRMLSNKNNKFQASYRGTIGPEFSALSHEGINFELWDTAGNSNFDALGTAYQRDTDMAVLCIDRTRSLSSQNIDKYIQEIQAIRNSNNQPVPILLVVTKADALRVITTAELIEVKDKLNSTDYVCNVSAKNKDSLDNFLALIVRKTHVSVPLLENTLPAIEQALSLLAKESDLHQQITLLKDRIANLSEPKKILIGVATLQLVRALTSNTKYANNTLAIEQFEKTCISAIGHSYPRIASAVLGVVVTAVVAVLAAAVGFGVGFLAGSWSGPGAFVTGLIAASAAAVSVVAASSAIGIGGGFFAGKAMLKHLNAQNAPILDVGESARSGFKCS